MIRKISIKISYSEIRLNYFKKVHSRQQIIFDNVTYGNEEIKRGYNDFQLNME